MTRELVLWLIEEGHEPLHLRPRHRNEQVALQAGLQEAIALREGSQVALSLALLNRLESEGFENGWIEHQRACGLLQLGDRQQASERWQQLSASSDPALAAAAAQELEQLFTPLLQALQALCSEQGWQAQHLAQALEPGQHPGLLAILEESSACRDAQRAQLAHELVERTEQEGWSSPWLKDCRARALAVMSQHEQACNIWADLQHHELQAVAEQARKMLGHYQPERIRHPLQDQLEGLRQQGREADAEVLLLDHLVSNPNDDLLWQVLEQQLKPQIPNGDLLQRELAEHELQLALQERWLQHCETLLP
jgi:hypothetical protein